MRVIGPLLIAAMLLVGACTQRDRTPPPGPAKVAPVNSGSAGADGVRRVAVEAGGQGYRPERIESRPGEKLILVFTRTVEGECLSEVKVMDGPVIELPMRQPVEVAVTAPASGEIRFACGMDMFSGVIVAGPG